MAKIVAIDPFGAVDAPDKHKMVTFLKTSYSEELPKLNPKEDAGIVHQSEMEIYSYILVREGRLPDMNPLFKKVAKIPQTMRNWIVTQELARLSGA